MKELRGLDLKRALLVPSSVFASPEEVLYQGSLSVAQKLAILRRWEFDARRVAGYGGPAGARQDIPFLMRVRRAIQRLTQSTPAPSWRKVPEMGSRTEPLRPAGEKPRVAVSAPARVSMADDFKL